MTTKRKPKIVSSGDNQSMPPMRRFALKRKTDVSGMSGVGFVCAGALMPSGQVVVEWCTSVKSIGIYHSIAEFEAIHHVTEGHGEVVWVD